MLPVVLKHLHYHTDAEALVVVADSDNSPVHQSAHDEAGKENMVCRLCQLRSVVSVEKNRLRSIAGRDMIKVALGLAVPAIEAWYRCGLDPHVNESTWHRKLQSEPISYTKNSLKVAVYGTDRPSIELETIRARESAVRLADSISLLEQLFPNGFGSFVRDVRQW